ncbi:MAG: hypothetical protein AAGD10_07380 [Myxococcota bacterium]
MGFLRKHGRWLFLLGGLLALVFIIRDIGLEQVLAAVRQTSALFHWILLLEVLWISFDTLALRALYGEAASRVPLREWLRSACSAYAIMILLPAGRAGGEVARGALLYKHAGTGAVDKSTQLQAAVLIANAVISVPAALAVGAYVGWTHSLTLLVLGNGLVTLGIGVGIILVLRRSRLGAWLQKRFGLAKGIEERVASGPLLRALAFTSTGRVVQTLQYAVILWAVGGELGLQPGLITQGVHLVGAGLGDFVPNAVGITEGAYRLFAAPLGLGEAPERAVAIALVARLAQFCLAFACLMTGPLLRPRS